MADIKELTKMVKKLTVAEGVSTKKRAKKQLNPVEKKEVRNMISRRIEDKIRIWSISRQLSSTSNAPDTNNIMALSPYASQLQIDQGTGQGSRVANRIKITKSIFKFMLTPQQYSASANPAPRPQIVRMVLFYDRLNTTVTPTPFANNDFFDNNNSVGGFAGNTTDLVRMFNTDRYRILKVKTFKLGFANYGGTNANADAQTFANNDYKLNIIRKYDITKHLVKNVLYVDTNSNPSSRGLWVMFYTMPANTSTFGSTDFPLLLSGQVETHYEDA